MVAQLVLKSAAVTLLAAASLIAAVAFAAVVYVGFGVALWREAVRVKGGVEGRAVSD